MTIYAIDFGTGASLAIYGPEGVITKKSLRLPRVKGGRPRAMEFTMVVEALMGLEADVVTESATIGSSGCEVQDVVDLLARHPDRSLYTLSTRAVKNFRADNPGKYPWKKGARYADSDAIITPEQLKLYKQVDVHEEDALILYMIATETPNRLFRWEGPSEAADRIHRSVRPMDKRDYKDERALKFLEMLPPFEGLPAELQEVLGVQGGYSASVVMPFAMATTEPYLDEGPRDERRRRYEKIIGLYDRGYPSFYRRATIVWMQDNAKRMASEVPALVAAANARRLKVYEEMVKEKKEKNPDFEAPKFVEHDSVTNIEDVPAAVRKEAWRLTQRQVRRFFHLTMAHQGR